MTLRSFFWLALLAASAYAGQRYWQQQHQHTRLDRYKLHTVIRGNVRQTVAANGTINPVVLVNVGTQVSGRIKKLHADFNDQVKAGQTLAELDPALFQSQLNQSEAGLASANASLDLAKANEKRLDSLFAKRYVTRQEYDQAIQARRSAEAQVEVANAQVKRDRTNLGYTIIPSPVSGVVVAREVDIGQTVAASFQTPILYKIAQDLKVMQIDTTFAEADIGSIRVGQNANFTVDAFPNRNFSGKVKKVRLNPTIQQNVVTYNVVIAISNPELILLPGMTAYVNIIVAEHDNVLLVPNAALRYQPPASGEDQDAVPPPEPGSGTVYILRQNKPRAVGVKLGITDNKVTEVIAGELKSGDQIITGEKQAPGGAQNPTGPRFRLF